MGKTEKLKKIAMKYKAEIAAFNTVSSNSSLNLTDSLFICIHTALIIIHWAYFKIIFK